MSGREERRAIGGVLEVLERAVGDAVLALPVGRVGEPREDRGDHARAPWHAQPGRQDAGAQDDDGVEREGEQRCTRRCR